MLIMLNRVNNSDVFLIFGIENGASFPSLVRLTAMLDNLKTQNSALNHFYLFLNLSLDIFICNHTYFDYVAYEHLTMGGKALFVTFVSTRYSSNRVVLYNSANKHTRIIAHLVRRNVQIDLACSGRQMTMYLINQFLIKLIISIYFAP